eukprot:g19665.t1
MGEARRRGYSGRLSNEGPPCWEVGASEGSDRLGEGARFGRGTCRRVLGDIDIDIDKDRARAMIDQKRKAQEMALVPTKRPRNEAVPGVPQQAVRPGLEGKGRE